jgi:hypothetical protein
MLSGVDRGLLLDVCGAHLFVLSTDAQADLEPAGGRGEWQQWEMGLNFLSVTWHGEAFHRPGLHYTKV